MPWHECLGYKGSAGQAGFKKPFRALLGSPAIHRRARGATGHGVC
jgi:hypothetical protein